jgi:tetratricopeptide (TPR) repeat protein
MPTRRHHLVIAMLLLALSAAARAQSVLVLDSGEDARRCSGAAEIAANLRTTSREDFETCTRALALMSLRPRDRAGTLVNRGIVAAALDELDDALADYERAMAMLPELPEPYVGRGNVLFLRKDYPAAIADYDRALALGIGRRHIALLNRGMALEVMGQLDAAEKDYREAQALAPEWPLPKPRIERVLAKRKAAAASPPPPP